MKCCIYCLYIYIYIYRHHCFNLAISPEPEGGQIHQNIVTVLRSQKIKLKQKEDVGAKIFHRELAYRQSQL